MRVPIQSFHGLNNVADQLDLGLSSLIRADNVLVTDRAKIERFPGFALGAELADENGAYVTLDRQRMYVIDSGELWQMNDDLTHSVLRTGLSSGQYHFAEVNGVAFYTNGIDRGIITPNGSGAWGVPTPDAPTVSLGGGSLPAGRYQVVCTFVDSAGMESGNSDVSELDVPDGFGLAIVCPALSGYAVNVYINANTVFYLAAENATAMVYSGWELGRELPFLNTSAPRGIMPAVFKGQMFTVEPFMTADVSMVWWSKELHYHHFNESSDGIALPGIVKMAVATKDAYIVGTDRQIYAWDGAAWTVVFDYGTVDGHHACIHRGPAYFWTLRGLCSGPPFRNLTEEQVSVAPGVSAGGCVIEERGMRRYVVALQTGGTAYNARVPIIVE